MTAATRLRTFLARAALGMLALGVGDTAALAQTIKIGLIILSAAKNDIPDFGR